MGVFDYFILFSFVLTGRGWYCVLLPRPSGTPSAVFYYPALRAPLLLCSTTPPFGHPFFKEGELFPVPCTLFTVP